VLLTEHGDEVVGSRFLEQLKPIQRFVIGLDRPETETAGYILSHPKLGMYLREEHCDPEDIQATQAAFVRWGRKTVERLNSGALGPQEIPEYLLQYYTQHLWDVAAPAEVFLELVEHVAAAGVLLLFAADDEHPTDRETSRRVAGDLRTPMCRSSE
jgi:hypothetical protein